MKFTVDQALSWLNDHAALIEELLEDYLGEDTDFENEDPDYEDESPCPIPQNGYDDLSDLQTQPL